MLRNERPLRYWGILTLKLTLATVVLWILVETNAIRLDELQAGIHRPFHLLVACLLLSLTIPVSAWRWHVLMGVQGIKIPGYKTTQIVGVGMFFTTFLPGAIGGDAIRVACIARSFPHSRTRAVFSVVVDRMLGITGLFFVGTIAGLTMLPIIFARPQLTVLAVAVAGLFIGALATMIAAIPLIRVLEGSERVSRMRDAHGWRAYAWQLILAIAAHRNAKGRLLIAFALSIANHVLVLIALAIVAALLGIGNLQLRDYGFAAPMTFMANLLPITPGGLGVGEAAFDQICKWIASGSEVVAYGTIFLLFRVVGIVAMTPGLFLYLADRRAIDEIVGEAPAIVTTRTDEVEPN
jgi:glycosyltransferase 2 family protein